MGQRWSPLLEAVVEESCAGQASAAASRTRSRNLTFAKAPATVARFRLPLGPDFAASLCDSLSLCFAD